MSDEINYSPEGINYPENLESKNNEIRSAGLIIRVIAGIIDHTICFILFLILTLVPFKEIIYKMAFSSFYFGGYFLAMTLFIEVYYFMWEYFLGGQTPGKLFFKLRVINKTGKLNITHILFRNFLRCSYLIPPLFIIPDLFFMAFDKYNRRIGDLIANTVVVKKFIG
jgi:uncharacterized RDD family membrane protein YckC